MRAMRTWKRDGSVNIMRLNDAAENIKKNTGTKYALRDSVESIIDRLQRGEVMETRLAFFKIYLRNGEYDGYR